MKRIVDFAPDLSECKTMEVDCGDP